MGTWGSGNFDSDGALDYLATLVKQLVKTIDQTFAQDLARLDDDGETVLMPSIQILAILYEQCHAAPPKPDVVAGWKDRYLRIFDAEIDGLKPVPGYKEERRQVIEDTLNTLEQHARKFWIR